MSGSAFHAAILDDDPLARVALVRLLKTTGIVAQDYGTSDELFEAVARKRPDCLLLDLEMPEMSGLDVLKYLDERHIRIPTIIISGHNEADHRSGCLKAGALSWLSKPLDPEHLIRTIENISVPSQGEKATPMADRIFFPEVGDPETGSTGQVQWLAALAVAAIVAGVTLALVVDETPSEASSVSVSR